MRLSLIPTIIYECTEETPDGKVVSKFFTSFKPRRSRSAAITHLLDRFLSDDNGTSDYFLRLYVRNLRTGQRIELVSSETLYQPFENIHALEEELLWYQQNKLKVETALFYHGRNAVAIMGSNNTRRETLQIPGVSMILADDYWVFVKGGKVKGMVA